MIGGICGTLLKSCTKMFDHSPDDVIDVSEYLPTAGTARVHVGAVGMNYK